MPTPHRLRIALTSLTLAAAGTVALADDINWPALPKTCFVSGRPANISDVNSGCAAFLIGGPEKSVGRPLNVQIPQYALHVDRTTGRKTQVILMQAEEHSGIEAVGFKDVQTSKIGAALLSEMQLLGTTKPR